MRHAVPRFAAAVLPVVGLAAVVAPVPASAQTAVVAQQYPMDYVRLQGRWIDPGKNHRYVFTPGAPGRLRFSVERATTGEELARRELSPFARGSMQGTFTTGPAHTPADPRNSGTVTFSVDRAGGFHLFVSSGNLLGETRETAHNSSRPHIRPEPSMAADAKAAWSGVWRTNRGLVEFKPLGNAMIAYLPGEVASDLLGRPSGIGSDQGLEVAILPSTVDAYGAWEHPKGSVRWGDIGFRLAPDGKSFSGWYTDVTTGDQRLVWSGERATAENTQAPLPADLVARFEGEWLTRHGVLRVRKVGVGAKLDLTMPGRTVSADLRASSDGRSVEGTIDGWPEAGVNHFVARTGQASPSTIVGEHVRKSGRPATVLWRGVSEARSAAAAGIAGLSLTPVPQALYDRFSGDWVIGSAKTRILRDDKGVMVIVSTMENDPLHIMRAEPSADGRSLEMWNTGILGPQKARIRLTLRPTGSEYDAHEVTADGSSGQLVWDAYNEARRKPGGAAATPNPGDHPTAPAMPAPSGSSPVPIVRSTPLNGSGPVAADGFKPVRNFAVRLDKVVAEDRYWHVYLTLRNITPGVLVQAQGVDVRFEDTDGVGVESGQAVRAKPGYPELFGSPPPTTRPGGELPVKFVFDMRSGTDPARVIVMEGDRQVTFDLG